MVTNSKILVTGGSGFIGTNIVNKLESLGNDVISISKNLPKSYRYNSKVSYFDFDLTKTLPKSLYKELENIDYIINCAGYIDHITFEEGGMNIFEDHFKSLYNIAKISKQLNIKTLVHFGSSDEYGNLASPLNEEFRESPVSPYALSKLTSTHFLQQMFQIRSSRKNV